MGRLAEIKTEINALLSAITIANGYTFTMGTVGQPDRAKVTAFPAACLSIVSEAPASEPASYHGYDLCQCEITVFCTMTALQAIPIQSIDAEYDVVIAAIKDKFHASLGALPLTGNAVLRYTGFKKITSQSGDAFAPDKAIISCEILYNSNE